MKIDREELFRLYMLQVNEICDTCDWKNSFGPEEIVSMIACIIENNPTTINEL